MTLIKLIMLLCIIESDNNPAAIGDSGNAVGILQIHPIMVREVNRLGKKQFSGTDRLDPEKSKSMAYIFLSRRVQNANALTNAEVEDCVKSWNGGPSWRKGSDKKLENVSNYYQRFLKEAR